MDNFGDWMGNLHEEAEKTRIQEEIEKRLKDNCEYQEKVRTINIQIDMIDKKRLELVNEKVKLKEEYGNAELKKMGSKYTYKVKVKNTNDPFEGLFNGIFGNTKRS